MTRGERCEAILLHLLGELEELLEGTETSSPLQEPVYDEVEEARNAHTRMCLGIGDGS